MTLPPTRANDSARRPTWRRWAVASVCWVAVIWGHSLLAGPESSAESGLVVAVVRPLFEALGLADLDLMTLVVRKCAHFSEYAVLGVLASLCLRARRRDSGAAALPVELLAAFMCPFVDEAIQLGVPGRTGQLTDALIDLAGLITGVLLVALLGRLLPRAARKG